MLRVIGAAILLPILCVASAMPGLAQPVAGKKAVSSPVPSPAPAPSAAGTVSDIGYMTADQLSRRCSQSDPSGSSYCFAYIAAVTDTARAYEIWLSAREFCLPKGISQAEIRRAFMTYVSAYPAQSSGQAASVVVNALKQTYPCD